MGSSPSNGVNVRGNGLNVVVIQWGARRGYSVPRMLEDAGVLHSFHTSVATSEHRKPFLFKVARFFLPKRNATFGRRVIRGVPERKLHSSWMVELVRTVTLLITGSNVVARFTVSEFFSRRIGRKPLNGANVVLSVDGCGGAETLRQLKEKGLTIAVDIAITPLALEIVSAAEGDWPDWPTTTTTKKERALFLRWYEEIIAIADIVLYPSDGVLRGLKQLNSFDVTKSRRVPYAMGAITPLPPKPLIGRICFAGSDGLRKGLPYLAEAAKILASRGCSYEFVVAGAVPAAIRSLSVVSELNFLGHLSREEMAKEMAIADVFCLPSLAEGTAAVILEALASGTPVVVTEAAGSPISNGVEGYVVAERDSLAIADAINQIVSDRLRRMEMSRAALRTSQQLSPDLVKQRLCQVLGEALDG